MKLLSGLTKNAGTIGAASVLLSTNNMNDLISSIQQISAGVIHAPTYPPLQNWLSTDGRNLLMAYVGASIGDAILPSQFQQYARAIQKGVIGYGVASGLNRVLYSMTHSEIKGENILNQVRNAPTIAQAQMLYY